ncbi:NUDIX hydrolase [Lentilactobacillus kribbianus]|uniref:NUDIX hydrolase n=1 Tax=Lentilactobacillus kribbianus TaxID=2729622 RepID=UPI001551F26A|nr:NUDIX hydrolase [Lentilactobacillus kribbianus]
MEFEEKVLKSEPIYNGAIIDVERQLVELPDKDTAHREIVHHANAVGILAITTDNKIILEKQWRAPIKATTIEIPAGKLDRRDANFKDAVVRELNEETRYRAEQVERITGFYSSVGFTDEYMELYLATGLTPVSSELPRDQGEFLEIQAKTLPEAMAMVKSGEIEDAKTIMAIWYWQLKTK